MRGGTRGGGQGRPSQDESSTLSALPQQLAKALCERWWVVMASSASSTRAQHVCSEPARLTTVLRGASIPAGVAVVGESDGQRAAQTRARLGGAATLWVHGRVRPTTGGGGPRPKCHFCARQRQGWQETVCCSPKLARRYLSGGCAVDAREGRNTVCGTIAINNTQLRHCQRGGGGGKRMRQHLLILSAASRAPAPAATTHLRDAQAPSLPHAGRQSMPANWFGSLASADRCPPAPCVVRSRRMRAMRRV